MGRIIGIDFGTTSSYMTYPREAGGIDFIQVQDSRRIPSLMYFPENESEKPLFGQSAQRQALLNPQRTVVAAKKLLGKTYEEVKPFLPQFSYKVSPDAAGFPVVDMGHSLLHPQEIIALFLMYLREQAQLFLNEPVEDCLITVPANFNLRETASLKEAFEIAGWHVLRILAEPTAALMAVQREMVNEGTREGEDRFLVLDIGGSSTDVSVQVISDGIYEVVSISGNNMLGGIDFDHALVQELVRYFYNREGVDYSSDKVALYRLWEAAEKAKIELSSAEHAQVQLPFMSVHGVVKTLEAPVSKAQFEQACTVLVDKCLDLCQVALSLAGIRPGEIYRYFLVGAACRTPLIKEKTEQFFGKKPGGNFNPEEVVAIGAGLYSAVLSGQAFTKNMVLLDSHPFSVYAGLLPEMSKTEKLHQSEEGVRATSAEHFEGNFLVFEEGTSLPARKDFRIIFSDIQPHKTYEIYLSDYRNGKPVADQTWGVSIPTDFWNAETGATVMLTFDIDPNSMQFVQFTNERTQATIRQYRKSAVTSLSDQSLAAIRYKLGKQEQVRNYAAQFDSYSDFMPAGLRQRFTLELEALKFAGKIQHAGFQEKFTGGLNALFQEFAQKQMIGYDKHDQEEKPTQDVKKEFLPGIIRHLTDRVDNETRLMRFIQELLAITGHQECALFGSRLVKIQGEHSLGLIERSTFITELNRIRHGLIHYLEEMALNQEVLPYQYHNILIFAEAQNDA